MASLALKSILIIFLLVSLSSGASHYIRSGATGTGSGNDWTNAYTDWPEPLIRGDTYWFADGTYSGQWINVDHSGTTRIYIMKANATNHGTNTGWSSTYGDGQAIFTNQLRFYDGYYTMDGQDGGGPGNWEGTTRAYGFKIADNTDDGGHIYDDCITLYDWGTSQENCVFEHIEMTSTDAGGVDLGSGSGKFSHIWIHDTVLGPFQIYKTGWNIDYLCTGVFATEQHVETFVIEPSASLGSIWINNSMFTYCAPSTGGIMWQSGYNRNSQLYIVGCTFYNRDGWGGGNGAIAGWGAGYFDNVHVWYNTFLNINGDGVPILGSSGVGNSGCDAKNNLFVNCNTPDFSFFPDHDYNYFINSGGSAGEDHEQVAASGNPFVDYANLNFNLTGATNAGTALSSYTTDPMDHTRGADGNIDRGAYEYVSGGVENQYPVVDAGTDQSCTYPQGVTLAGSATDDGLPEGSSIAYTWTKNSGPGTVVFGDHHSAASTASFSQAGTYVLKLAATDSILTSYDTMTVTVLPEPQQEYDNDTLLIYNADLNFYEEVDAP